MRLPETKEVVADLAALLAGAGSAAPLDSAHAEIPESFRRIERLRRDVTNALHERRAEHGKAAIDSTTVKLTFGEGAWGGGGHGARASSEIVQADYGGGLGISIRTSYAHGENQWCRVAWTSAAWPEWIPGPWWSWIDQLAADLDAALDPWRVAVEKAAAEKVAALSDAEKRIAAIVRAARKVA